MFVAAAWTLDGPWSQCLGQACFTAQPPLGQRSRVTLEKWRSGEVFQEEATVPDLDVASVVEGRETTMRKDSLGLPGAWHCDGGCRALLGLG